MISSKWGNGRGGRPWRRKREEVFKRDCYLCQPCKRKGRITQATQVDHIIPLAKQGSDDMGNLQGICAQCHEAKTLADEGKVRAQQIGSDGWPIETTG